MTDNKDEVNDDDDDPDDVEVIVNDDVCADEDDEVNFEGDPDDCAHHRWTVQALRRPWQRRDSATSTIPEA